jgi:hypothetical protein
MSQRALRRHRKSVSSQRFGAKRKPQPKSSKMAADAVKDRLQPGEFVTTPLQLSVDVGSIKRTIPMTTNTAPSNANMNPMSLNECRDRRRLRSNVAWIAI